MEQRWMDGYDYAVFGVTLAASIVVGIYYGCCGKRQLTLDEYLLGNRKLPCLPVAISLLVTFQSGISLLGTPVEIYYFGTQITMGVIGLAIGYFLVALLVVPVFHPLKLTSSYEYLELRYGSRTVRRMGVCMGILFTVLYMAIALFVPALTLEAVSGIPKWLSVAVIGAVATFYTMLGGMKAVVWTDVLQFVVMVTGIVTLLVMGTASVGGLNEVWRIADQGTRIQFFNLDPDPTTRQTLWTMAIGTISHWMALGVSQSGVQRICSTSSITEAKTAVLFNIPVAVLYELMTGLLGLVIYGYYSLMQCDPEKSGSISSQNQLVPYFVMDQLGSLPGLPGLFLSSIFSATLSTLSSGLSAIAAVIWEDIIGPRCGNINSLAAPTITKLIVGLGGAVIIGLAFVAMQLEGTITQITHSVLAASSGPLLGVYLLGLTFPWASSTGAIVGCLLSFILSAVMSVGSNLYPMPYQSSPPVPILGCAEYENSTTLPVSTSGFIEQFNSTHSFQINGATVLTDAASDNTTFSNQSDVPEFFCVSFLWYHLIGVLCTYLLGVLVTVVSGGCKQTPADPELVIPLLGKLKCYRGRLWMKSKQNSLHLQCFGESSIWVRYVPGKYRKVLSVHREHGLAVCTKDRKNQHKTSVVCEAPACRHNVIVSLPGEELELDFREQSSAWSYTCQIENTDRMFVSLRACYDGSVKGEMLICNLTSVECLCPPPEVEHATITVTGTEAGDEAMYTCDQGYKSSGLGEVTCMMDGTWSTSQLTCTGNYVNL
ncbi:hypothetical protein ScPMuIL_005749 [Solemya velum]